MTEKSKPAQEQDKVIENKRAKVAESPRKRPIRVTRDLLVYKGSMAVPESVRKPGFKYFWARTSEEEPYRHERYLKMGYDYVTDSRGNKVVAGQKGGGSYLLEIPEELHAEWRAMKNEIKAEHTAEIKELKSDNSELAAKGVFEKQLNIK